MNVCMYVWLPTPSINFCQIYQLIYLPKCVFISIYLS